MNISKLTLLALLGILSQQASLHAADRPPNFVFILVDDLGQRDLGCYGSTFYETPRIDALAKSGLRFTSAYSACPVCSPTRASIQSGKYPGRLHTTDYFGGPTYDKALHDERYVSRPVLPPNYLERLPLEEQTIAESLAAAGYATFYTGKWHLGPKGYWPEDQGYQTNVGGNRASTNKNRKFFSPYNNPDLPDGPDGEQLDERLANEAANFIRDHREQPFLVFFAQFDVHVPLNTKPELRKKYRQKKDALGNNQPEFGKEGERDVRHVQNHPVYSGMVESMDTAVGIVLDALGEAGVEDETIVIFTSDNGGLSTAEGSPTSNLPLRAGKGWYYEGGVRVPLIIRWPGKTKAGATTDSYVISTDYYPTILEMAGLKLKPEQHVDGRSFAPLLKGESQPARGPIYWHYPHYGNQGGRPFSAIRDGDWKLIEFLEDGRTELYDVAHDESETKNLAAAEPERTAMMQKQLHLWRQEAKVQMPQRNPKLSPPK
ncbi:sulfatase [Lacipirellula parvula]|uniref:Arylsulfatase n=1 Tax=Lacipirellula parvula TaxID=2650471 RepID=A0A5K7XER3_9BACT|nr:sulfatase [Lacipirellula parvula]BBO35290.1 arylsulfatase [Lacipirellula parvula]